MKKILISILAFTVLALTGCQESLKSSDYYRDHLDEAQQTEKKCKDMRQAGKAPSGNLSKNCDIAHDVLFHRATGSAAAAIKNSEWFSVADGCYIHPAKYNNQV